MSDWGNQPAIDISYSPRFDWMCSIVHSPSINVEWETELMKRLSEFDVGTNSAIRRIKRINIYIKLN